MAKPLLSDALWKRIEPLLPPHKPRRRRFPGRKPIDDRKALTGILFVLKTGINWEDLPQETDLWPQLFSDVSCIALWISSEKILTRLYSGNSRSLECDSSWFAHFDSDRMIRHHRDVEKDMRYGLLEPDPARFRRSSTFFES